MVRRGLVISAVLAAGVLSVAGVDAGAATLIWPESRQPVPNGGAVYLWEDFHLDPGPMAIPCQASPPSTVVVNGQEIDEAREREAPTWSECGSVTVTGGWVAIGFDQKRVKAVAVPAISLTEPDGCSYELSEVEGRENELVGFASWTVNGAATLIGGATSPPAAPCSPDLPLTGSVELGGPQAGGVGVMPWGALASSEGGQEEAQAAESLSKRMVTATRLAKLGQLFPSTATTFTATSAGTLLVSWYAAAGGSARASSAPGVLVARGTAVFSASGTKRLRVTPTPRGRRLLRHHVTLAARASFKPHGSAAVVVAVKLSGRR